MNTLGKNQRDKLIQEFHDFMESPPHEVPHEITASILNKVRADLHPSNRWVFSKAAGIHVIVASLSLLFCPQLGVGPLGGGHGLMALFLGMGLNWCAFICGAMFLGFSSFLTAWLLTREELRCANAHGYSYAVLFTALSFAALMLLGAEGNVDLFLLWNLGALIAGISGLKLGAFARFRICSAALAKAR